MTADRPTASLDELRRIARELIRQATAFVAPAKLKEVARRLLSGEGAERIMDSGHALDLAEILGGDLALFTPSLSGSTAIDRLARHYRPQTPAEAEALRLLRQARFCLFKVVAQRGLGVFTAEDRTTGARFTVESETMSPQAVGFVLAARLCWPGADAAFPVMPAISLNDAALAAAETFIRPGGKGLSHPQRCAEAVYRQALRGGAPVMEGTAPPPESELPWSEGLPHDIARRWAESDAAPSAEDMQDIRDGTCGRGFMESLDNCRTARERGMKRLAAAYERIIVLQMETIQRRADCGVTLGVSSLDTVYAEIRDTIGRLGIPRGILDVFEELRRRVQVRAGARASRPGDDDLDKVLGRIQALRAKTVEQGCTEQEAMLAARKVAELLDRYGLSLSEVDLKNQTCEGVGIETDRRRNGPIDECVPEIGVFCDCRVWVETAADGRLRYVFFGMPADVAAARYLYELIDRTFADETAAFKAGPIYADHPTGTRRSASHSFQVGLAHGIRAKLGALRQERTVSMQSTGRDLVPIKHGVVEDELAKLGLNFTRKARGRGRSFLRDAYHAGHAAGSRFEVHHGIEEK